jgi:ElaB/YqjD/DUF883 family membrane-anchored ribosome-binding protein
MARERDLTREFDDLKADMKSMMDHVSALSQRLGERASQTAGSVPERLHQAVAATAERAGAVGERAREVAGEIEKQGKAGIGALSGYVRQYPVASLVIVFGLGLLIAKVLDR